MSSQSYHDRPRNTVMDNVRIFDGEGFTSPQSIMIVDHHIGRESGWADSVDGENGFLIPGLIDAHVHITKPEHLNELAKHGVTTALELAMYPAEKMQQLRGGPGLPNVKTAGTPATKAGSVHSCVLPLPSDAFVDNAQQAEGWVQKKIEQGSDYIKIIADVPGPDQASMDAITAAARTRGKIVIAHAASYTPFNMALAAGVDVFTHLPLDKAVDTSMAAKTVAGNIVSVPTLTMMKETSKTPFLGTIMSMLLKPGVLRAIIRNRRNGVGKQTYDNATASIAEMRQAGVTILAGTDCHEEPNSPFDVPHGESLHRELDLLVDAGTTPLEALRAATLLPAKSFGLADRGEIRAGLRADLVILGDDPTKNIGATRSIRRVWCNGIEVPKCPN